MTLPMSSLGTKFDVQSKTMEVGFDNYHGQHFLCFNFMMQLQVSIPELLVELNKFQQSGGFPVDNRRPGPVVAANSSSSGAAQAPAPQARGAVASKASMDSSGATSNLSGKKSGSSGSSRQGLPGSGHDPATMVTPAGLTLAHSSMPARVGDASLDSALSVASRMGSAAHSDKVAEQRAVMSSGSANRLAALPRASATASAAQQRQIAGPIPGASVASLAGLAQTVVDQGFRNVGLSPSSPLQNVEQPCGGGAPYTAGSVGGFAPASGSELQLAPAGHPSKASAQPLAKVVQRDGNEDSALHYYEEEPVQGEVQARAVATSKLVAAVKHGRLSDAVAAIRQGADVNCPSSGGGSQLHQALLVGGSLELFNQLIQAACDVNSAGPEGYTPLHLAIKHHSSLSPMVIRLLISSKADLQQKDNSGRTPADLATRSQGNDPGAMLPRTRQMMEEVLKNPTLAVCVADEHDVVCDAYFADMTQEHIVFHTDTAIGMYHLSDKRIVMKQKLTQMRIQSEVRGIAVNPRLGTVAVFLEVRGSWSESQTMQDLVLVWPTGQTQEEEALKLSIAVGATEALEVQDLAPCLICSTSSGPLMLLCRTRGGSVILWRLKPSCSQVSSENLLTTTGGLVTISSDGQWVAVVEHAKTGGPNRVDVWYREMGRRSQPQKVASVSRRPPIIAICGSDTAGAGCHLALAGDGRGTTPAPIEVLRVGSDGQLTSLHRVELDLSCRLLSFCHESANLLLSAHDNGLVVVSNLSTGKSCITHDDTELRSVSISPDLGLIVTSVANCFRVYKVGDFAEDSSSNVTVQQADVSSGAAGSTSADGGTS